MGLLGKLFGRPGRRVEPPLQSLMGDLIDLPPGWAPGIAADAPGLAQDDMGDQSVVGVAQEVGHRGGYTPSLLLKSWGPAAHADAEALLDTQAREFEGRDGWAVARRALPVGPAVRVVHLSEGASGAVALVGHFMATSIGGFYLQGFCAASDLDRYEATFDAAAASFHVSPELVAQNRRSIEAHPSSPPSA